MALSPSPPKGEETLPVLADDAPPNTGTALVDDDRPPNTELVVDCGFVDPPNENDDDADCAGAPNTGACEVEDAAVDPLPNGNVFVVDPWVSTGFVAAAPKENAGAEAAAVDVPNEFDDPPPKLNGVVELEVAGADPNTEFEELEPNEPRL